MSKTTDERQTLNRVLGIKDVIALSFGTMIGWGWIMLAGVWVTAAGVIGAMVAFLIGAVLCIFVGLTYAELTPALPLAGGELVFSYRGLGYKASWMTGWMITFAYVGVAAWEGPALVTAIDYIIPIPRAVFLWNVAGFDVYLSWVLVGSLGGLILALLNFRGAKPAAVFQLSATIAMAIGGVLFFFGGVVAGDIANMVPASTGFNGIIVVLLMVPAMFVGFDVIPQTAEEMNIPLHKIAKVLIISILMAAAWYIIMIVGISLSAPPDIRDSASIPVAEAFAYNVGAPIVGKLMIIAAMCGILTSWNGFIIGATRVIFAMGRAKMLPPVFGKVHPKYQTPSAAIFLVGFITCISPLLGKSALVWFVDASAFGTVVAYFMVALSFVALRRKEPKLIRPYKVRGGSFVGICAALIALFFLSLYTPIGPGNLIWPYEWLMVLGWVVLGIILAIMNQKAYPDVSLREREYLMFGEEYAREKYLK
ncbi:MAG: amino acid permease [Eubacteriales bacterium]|nr:amino acid permease [Eubacteriales bacterium]MDD4583450.1 amino acid permease [Eubacteriales bacterium]